MLIVYKLLFTFFLITEMNISLKTNMFDTKSTSLQMAIPKFLEDSKIVDVFQNLRVFPM